MFDSPIMERDFAPMPARLEHIDQAYCGGVLYISRKPRRQEIKHYPVIVRCLSEHFATLKLAAVKPIQQEVVVCDVPLLPAPKIAGLLPWGSVELKPKDKRVIVPGVTQHGRLDICRHVDGVDWYRIKFAVGSHEMTIWRKQTDYEVV